jgi:hypothetical protein
MGTTANRSYPYPDSTSDTQIWDHFEDLADAIDADVNSLNTTVRGSWAAYTPGWVASVNPAIGNGTLGGRYRDRGKTVDFIVQITMGSTTTYGTGQWLISLPSLGAAFGLTPGPVFSAMAIDTSATAKYMLGCELDTTARFKLFVSGGSTLVGAAVPFTWASTDILRISGTYELA